MEVTNPARLVFPEDGITKGDVVGYYETIADLMMPFVAGRALTVERYPKGVGEGGFMQKNAPSHLGDDMIERHEVAKEQGGTTVYPVVLDPKGVRAFANLGVITFHAPPVTVADPENADWAIWDLDPPPGRFDLARAAARAMRNLLEDFGVTTALMASGSNGYHLRTRLTSGNETHRIAEMARGIAALGEATHPDLLTLAFRKRERGDRVFVDWLRNAPYSTSVVPWSLRARPGAPIAAPLDWEELDLVDPNGIRFETISSRPVPGSWQSVSRQDLTGPAHAVTEALERAGIVLEPFDRFRS
jgi:bifunctional non-homologous end joining protein LigD